MKITDYMISAILKKGILYEARNVDIDVEVPVEVEGKLQGIKIKFTAEHMNLRIEVDKN